MLMMMGVSLYTVRIVLEILGPIDYGIYNVVAGVVVMFSFLSNSMSVASQRFFSFELGNDNIDKLKKTFSTTIIIYGIIAIVILVMAETIGLWFLNNKMTIPANRLYAANWIFQFSVLSFMMTMFTIPYNALIIAHERMNVYAYVSVLEVVLKLIVVYLLNLFYVDKLILYAVLLFLIVTLVTCVYRLYCRNHFPECRFKYYWDSKLFYEIFSYSGWNLFGALANVFNNQGVNIILNLFFGPLVNTAQSIAYQINGAINQFVQNFMMAARPQIIKYYAIGERQMMFDLVMKSSKFSFLLLFVLTMPLFLETFFVLDLWLASVPEFVVLFTKLILVVAMIDSLSYPLMATAQATGSIKTYTSVVGTIMMLNLPISYLFLKNGFPPQVVFILAIVNSLACLYFRIYLLRGMVNFPCIFYLKNVLVPILCVVISSYLVPLYLVFIIPDGFFRFTLLLFVGLLSSLVSICLFALTKSEQKAIKKYIKLKI